VRELQPQVVLGKRVVLLDSLYPPLHGTQGEEQKGADQHKHWDQLPGKQRDKAPLGQEGEQDSIGDQDFQYSQRRDMELTSVRNSNTIALLIHSSTLQFNFVSLK
jgi:hypothetical protein